MTKVMMFGIHASISNLRCGRKMSGILRWLYGMRD
jgi:hypothetical protein